MYSNTQSLIIQKYPNREKDNMDVYNDLDEDVSNSLVFQYITGKLN